MKVVPLSRESLSGVLLAVGIRIAVLEQVKVSVCQARVGSDWYLILKVSDTPLQTVIGVSILYL